MKVYIDNLTNLLYNKKRMLCRFVRFLALAALVIATVTFSTAGSAVRQSAFISPLFFGESAADKAFLLCDQVLLENGEVLFSIGFAEEALLCGMLLELQYPPDVQLLSVERSVDCGDAVLSCADFGDRVRVLFDCCGNVYMAGELLRLRFVSDGIEDVQICFSEASAFVFDENVIVPLQLCFEKDDGPLQSEEPSASVALSRDEDSLGAHFSVSPPQGCFAAGVRVFLVDPVAYRVNDFLCVGVVCENGAFSGKINLPIKGKYCAILEVLGYCRGGVIKGVTYCYYIVDGVLY